MRLVIAYDDDPLRYREFARRLVPLGLALVVVEHPDALDMALDLHDVVAVLLDHDLRDVEGETMTGVQVAGQCLAERSVPVIVTSANHAGARNIAALLAEFAVPHRVISVTETSPEERWIGVLAEWAATDRRM